MGCMNVAELIALFLYDLVTRFPFSSSQRRCKKLIVRENDRFCLLATLSPLAVQLWLRTKTKCSSVLPNLSFIRNYNNNNKKMLTDSMRRVLYCPRLIPTFLL